MRLVWGLVVTFGLVFVNANAKPSLENRKTVVIVGGGLAGLTALHKLRKNNIDAILLEKNAAIGGRVLTLRDDPSGVVINAGAELVDSTHKELQALAHSLHVPIARRPGMTHPKVFYQIDDVQITFADLRRALHFRDARPIQQIAADQKILERVRKSNRRLRLADDLEREKVLDQITIANYLAQLNVSSWFYQMVSQTIQSEYGRDLSEVSVQVLFDYFAVEDGKLMIFPYNDESRYIVGGSDRLIRALAEPQKEFIFTGHHVDFIESKDDGYTLRIKTHNNEIVTVKADYVVLAAPPTANLGIEFRGKALESIHSDLNQAQYGKNSKLALIFDKRSWPPFRMIGSDPQSNVAYHVWEGTVSASASNYSLLSVLLGGEVTDAATSERIVQRILDQLEQQFPGARRAFKASRLFSWAESYAGPYRPGERNWEREHVVPAVNRRGRLFWVGDRWNTGSSGYMNDAIISALNVAQALSEELAAQPGSCYSLFREAK